MLKSVDELGHKSSLQRHQHRCRSRLTIGIARDIAPMRQGVLVGLYHNCWRKSMADQSAVGGSGREAGQGGGGWSVAVGVLPMGEEVAGGSGDGSPVK